MKKTNKFILKWLNIALLLFLSSCEKDLYENPIKDSQYKAEKFSLQNITKNKGALSTNMTKLLEAVNQVRQKNATAATNKIVYDSINNFYFDDQNGIKMSKNDYESYTFKVFRPNSDDKLENIIFEKKENQASFTAQLIKYEFTAEELNTYANDQTEQQVGITNLETNTYSRPCITYIEDDSPPSPGGGCCNYGGWVKKILIIDCTSMDSGGPDYTGGIGGGPMPNNPSTPTGPTATSPVGGIGGASSPTPPEETPCETLTNVKAEPKVQTGIDDLKTRTTEKFESTYEIERKMGYDEGVEYKTNFRVGGLTNVKVQTGKYIQGQAHNHPIDGFAIPSWGDINWTHNCENDNSNYNNNTAYSIIVSANPAQAGQTILYALTINDWGALQTAIAADYNMPDVLAETDPKLKHKMIMDLYNKNFTSSMLNNTTLQEKTFLQTFAQYGISLYKHNDATNKWEKLSINPSNSNNILPEPCN